MENNNNNNDNNTLENAKIESILDANRPAMLRVDLLDKVNVIFLPHAYISNVISKMQFLITQQKVVLPENAVISLNYLPVVYFDKIAEFTGQSAIIRQNRCNFVLISTFTMTEKRATEYSVLKTHLLRFLSHQEDAQSYARRYILQHPAGIRFEYTPCQHSSAYKPTVPTSAKESLQVPIQNQNPSVLDAPKKRKLNELYSDEDPLAPAVGYHKLHSKCAKLELEMEEMKLKMHAMNAAYSSCQFAYKLQQEKIHNLENNRLPVVKSVTAVNTAVKKGSKKLTAKRRSLRRQNVCFPSFKLDKEEPVSSIVSYRITQVDPEEDVETEREGGSSTESVEWD